MRYISLFSGIEAATVAWEPLGWEPLAFCEIDEFPSAVLAHRFPDVENLGDITKVDWKEVIARHGRPDVVVGGSPCQSFSIAGGRESLEGESRLMFEYVRALDEIRPRWFLWENVPGVLNTRDNAFAQAVSPGEFLTLNSSEWPSDAAVSFLSDTLEREGVPQRYSLSPKACAGIIRRAGKRGKPLPEPLGEALRAVAKMDV